MLRCSRRSGRVLVFFAALFVCAQAVAIPVTVFVDDDNCPGPGGGSDVDPYCRIQDAICALQTSGGTVYVRPGLYRESLRMFPAVSVVSTDGPAATTIDATGMPCTTVECMPSTINLTCSAIVYGSGSTPTDRLEGFRITGGSGLYRDFGNSSPPDAIAGGGIFIFNSSPTITNNEIVGNVLSHPSTRQFWGAGIYAFGGTYAGPITPQITNNLIAGNVANSAAGRNGNSATFSIGGGMYVGIYVAPRIEGNTFEGNVVGDPARDNQWGIGGAIVSYSLSPVVTPVISRNLIRDNQASDYGAGISLGQGYGVSTQYPSVALIENNLFERNQSHYASGAIHSNTTRAVVRNNTIVDNTAQFGGAIVTGPTGNPSHQLTLINNAIVFNAAPTYGSGGIGVYGSAPVLSHNDLYGNLPNNIGQERTDADYIGLDGNVSLDPLFVAFPSTTRDFHLQEASPLIDAGDDTQVSATDFDGAPRVQDGDGNGELHVDIGAFEKAGDAGADSDGDGVPDTADNCPALANPGQQNGDGDAAGDACDPCPADPSNDADTDGVCGDVDNCPLVANPGQQNGDGDAFGDACDDDDDNDGAADVADCAPTDRGVSETAGPVNGSLALSKDSHIRLRWARGRQGHTSNVYRGTITPGAAWNETAGCLLAETPDTTVNDDEVPTPDTAFFFVISARNACGESPLANGSAGSIEATLPCPTTGAETDGDGVPDLGDTCPLELDATLADGDKDFIGDVCDVCPSTADPDQIDTDADGSGDACDPCTDLDGDGAGDPGFPLNSCPLDNCPAVANPGQLDGDGDGTGDSCDRCPSDPANDADGDSRCANVDNCPAVSNSSQTDTDGDGLGDACDECTDLDGDGFGNPDLPAQTCPIDNCPTVANPGQTDLDGNGVGDDCQPDNDEDGIPPLVDNCFDVPNPDQTDGDVDGFGDACDCADADPTSWVGPSEVLDLQLDHDPSTGRTNLVWVAPVRVGATFVRYDSLRSGDPANFVTGGTCLEVNGTDLQSEDVETPLGDAVFYYLIRAENGCPELGDLGQDSSGGPRSALECP